MDHLILEDIVEMPALTDLDITPEEVAWDSETLVETVETSKRQQRQSSRKSTAPQRLLSPAPAAEPRKKKKRREPRRNVRYTEAQKALLFEAFQQYVLCPVEWRGGRRCARMIRLCKQSGLSLTQVDKWFYAR
jgi:hypothetical protein